MNSRANDNSETSIGLPKRGLPDPLACLRMFMFLNLLAAFLDAASDWIEDSAFGFPFPVFANHGCCAIHHIRGESAGRGCR